MHLQLLLIPGLHQGPWHLNGRTFDLLQDGGTEKGHINQKVGSICEAAVWSDDRVRGTGTGQGVQEQPILYRCQPSTTPQFLPQIVPSCSMRPRGRLFPLLCDFVVATKVGGTRPRSSVAREKPLLYPRGLLQELIWYHRSRSWFQIASRM